MVVEVRLRVETVGDEKKRRHSSLRQRRGSGGGVARRRGEWWSPALGDHEGVVGEARKRPGRRQFLAGARTAADEEARVGADSVQGGGRKR